MAQASENFLTPVARLVAGNLYKPNTTDATGNPLLNKSGPNVGKPRLDFYFAIAIPKGAEKHWAETPWGAIIWRVGHASFPQQAQSPAFAWKVTDGDSTVPNRKGRKPCDNEGWKGHWILKLSGGFAPKIFNSNGSAPIPEPDAVKLGYYVQVSGSVAGNGSEQQPGVFLNHNMVSLQGYGPEIYTGPDPTAVGFGQGVQLPAGASATPVGGMAPPAPGAAAGYVPPAPAATAPPAPAYVPPVPAAVLPTTPVPGFTAGLPLPPAAPVPVAPPAAPARVMLPKAGGHSYETLIAAGWTDETLRANGMMA